MACIDFLIWIGTPTKRYSTINGYIEEAKELGCCRRIPQVPLWAVSEKSRVFLVHRGDHKRPDLGSIFGYYTLKRIDDIEPHIEPQPTTPGSGQLPPTKPQEQREKPPPPPKYPVPKEQTKGEEERGCGMREAGAIYLVNALTSEITDAFRKKLPKELKETGNETIYPKEGSELFREAKREVLERRKPEAGELVLFKKPLPIFRRFPRAAFRNYLRIDGDKLLAQINKGGKSVTPTIPYCSGDIEPNKPMTKAQLVNCLAAKLELPKARVNKFFRELSKLVPDELNRVKSITLPDLGKMVVSERKARQGINPRTGKKILIPARKGVKFRPTAEMKNKIK